VSLELFLHWVEIDALAGLRRGSRRGRAGFFLPLDFEDDLRFFAT
jgi:hypothetical protein